MKKPLITALALPVVAFAAVWFFHTGLGRVRLNSASERKHPIDAQFVLYASPPTSKPGPTPSIEWVNFVEDDIYNHSDFIFTGMLTGSEDCAFTSESSGYTRENRYARMMFEVERVFYGNENLPKNGHVRVFGPDEFHHPHARPFEIGGRYLVMATETGEGSPGYMYSYSTQGVGVRTPFHQHADAYIANEAYGVFYFNESAKRWEGYDGHSVLTLTQLDPDLPLAVAELRNRYPAPAPPPAQQ